MNGEDYKVHRKAVLPLFFPMALKTYLPTINAKVKSFLEKFDFKLSVDAIDFHHHAMDFALETSMDAIYEINVADNVRQQFIDDVEKYVNNIAELK